MYLFGERGTLYLQVHQVSARSWDIAMWLVIYPFIQ